MKVRTGKEIFDEIKKLQDNMSDKYLSQFELLCNEKFISIDELLEKIRTLGYKSKSLIDLYDYLTLKK